MSRLTRKVENHHEIIGLKDTCAETCADNKNCSTCVIDKVIEKLADYEDKQEQGLMIILPVAEGTEVWCIGNCGELCDNWSMECSGCKEHEIVFSTNFDRNMVEQWGKTIFATESKAEEALAKMGGK